MGDDHKEEHRAIAHEIRDLSKTFLLILEQQKTEFEWRKQHANFATKQDLLLMETHIMSAISDFAAKQAAFNNRLTGGIDSVVTSVAGLSSDVAALNKKIDDLQNSSGGVTPEDQAMLNDLEAQGDTIAGKLETVAAALKALDAMTPPVVPVG